MKHNSRPVPMEATVLWPRAFLVLLMGRGTAGLLQGLGGLHLLSPPP